MKYLNSFLDSNLGNYFDYSKIIQILKKNHGWGLGTIKFIDEFEQNREYFLNPEEENEYAIQFHIFLTDKMSGRLRGEFNNSTSLKLGKWKIGTMVSPPQSFYNKLT